jgi:hypothetical protein
MAGSRFAQGVERAIRDAHDAKSGHQHRRPAARPGHSVDRDPD